MKQNKKVDKIHETMHFKIRTVICETQEISEVSPVMPWFIALGEFPCCGCREEDPRQKQSLRRRS